MLGDDPNSASGKSVVIDTLEWPPSALKAIEYLKNELEVSEACNRAKTVALAKISIALKELSGL